jgi:hypothetical protein
LFGIEILSSDVLDKFLGTLLVLQVGLSIQVLRFYIGNALRRGAVQKDQVSREKLILHYLHNHADMKISPDDFLESALYRVCYEHFPIVLLIVALVAL